MPLTPLFNRVIIKPEPKKERVGKAGIILGGTHEKTEELHGKVVAIGKDVAEVKVGDIVSFPAYGYDSVSDIEQTGDLMIVREPEILAVITPAN